MEELAQYPIQSATPPPWGPRALSALHVRTVGNLTAGPGDSPRAPAPGATAPTSLLFLPCFSAPPPSDTPSPFVLFCFHSKPEAFGGELIYFLEA